MKHLALYYLGVSLTLLPTLDSMAAQEKVGICHKGQVLFVPEPALKGHLGHGDHIGTCEVETSSTTETVSTATSTAAQVVEQVTSTVTTATTAQPQTQTVTTVHHYQYFPNNGVYFDQGNNTYFYQQNGQWQQAQSLPQGMQLDATKVVPVQSAATSPNMLHQQVMQQFGNALGGMGQPAQATVTETVRQYQYFPNNGVYFDQGNNTYFYQQNGQWQQAQSLPQGMQLDATKVVPVQSAATSPNMLHQQVMQQFGNMPAMQMGNMAGVQNAKTTVTETVHHYQYFPNNGVYFDQGNNTYFYQQNGQWQQAQSLPQGMQLDATKVVPVQAAATSPNMFHQQVVQQFSSAPAAQMGNVIIGQAGNAMQRVEQVTTITTTGTAQEGGVRQYQYYPNAGVYFDQGSNQYFYQQSGQWQQAQSLPQGIQLDATKVVPLQASGTPTMFHQQVVQKFGAPAMAVEKRVVTHTQTQTTQPIVIQRTEVVETHEYEKKKDKHEKHEKKDKHEKHAEKHHEKHEKHKDKH